MTELQIKRWFWLLPLLMAVVAYAPAPWGGLVWDDMRMLHEQLPALTSLGDVLHPPAGIPGWSYPYFRPVVTLSYLLDLRLFGASAAGFHVTNVLYHTLATFFVWLFLRRLLRHLPGGEGGAVVAAVVFAVHPIHTESVSWIAGRSDVLATLFLLPGLLLVQRWRDAGSVPALLAAGALYLLAALSKEIGLTGLVLAPLVLILSRKPRTETSWFAAGLVLVAATMSYFWLRQRAGLSGYELQPLVPGERFVLLVRAAAWYGVKVVFPWPQSNVVAAAMAPSGPRAAIILFAALIATGWAGWRWRRNGDGTPLLLAGWFWVTLTVPLWNAVGPLGRMPPLAERQLYLPSVAMSGMVGLAYCYGWSRGWRALSGVLAAAVIAVYTIGAISRGFVWQSNLALWTDATRHAPQEGFSWANLGLAQQALGDDGGALQSLARAAQTQRDPAERSPAHFGMGQIYLRRGDLADAEREFRTAIVQAPGYPAAFAGLASVYAARAELMAAAGDRAHRDELAGMAIHFYQRAVGRSGTFLTPRLAFAAFLARYGETLEREGDRATALARYQGALAESDALLVRIPVSRRDQVLTSLGAELNVDAEDLRRRAAAGIARLQ